MKRRLLIIIYIFILAGTAPAGNAPVFTRQTIETQKGQPSEFWKRWIDLNGDGLMDLILLIQNEEKVLIYLQSDSGFSEKPNQTIVFPEDTMWYCIFDICEHLGDEMLISTAKGLYYYKQDKGVFQDHPIQLLEAEQAVPINNPPITVSPVENSSDWIPVVYSDQTVFYQYDNKTGRLQSKRESDHQYKKNIYRNNWNNWAVGSNMSKPLWITNEADLDTAKRNNENDLNRENESFEKLIKQIKQEHVRWQYNIERKDVNADGLEDCVVWYFDGEIDIKTTAAIFLRTQNGNLPDKATQFLRCGGVPMHYQDQQRRFSILRDINNDQIEEILIAKMKKIPISADSMVEMLVSKGMEFTITIRQFNESKNRYSNRPVFKMDVTTMLPLEHWIASLVTFDGDFNADGRNDLIVRRSRTQCQIYLSSSTSDFFEREPALNFEIPAKSEISVSDLNQDGISDIFLDNAEKGQIVLFLSDTQKDKGTLQ